MIRPNQPRKRARLLGSVALSNAKLAESGQVSSGKPAFFFALTADFTQTGRATQSEIVRNWVPPQKLGYSARRGLADIRSTKRTGG